MGYNTKQGELIFSLLENSGGKHLTAEDISHTLGERDCPVGKATVYRHLEKMLRDGSVRKFVLHDGESACYQYVGGNADCCNHYHLKCSECGKLLHVECDFLDKVAAHIFEHHGFTLSEENTVLYGVCAECAERKKNEN